MFQINLYQYFFGQGYEKVIYLINVISPIIIAISLSNAIGNQYLLPTKKQKEFTISVTLGAIVNFILNIIFINLWKSIGASIATVMAECTVTGIQFYLVRKEIKFIDVVKIGKNYFIASIGMFIVSMLLNILIRSNLISIVLQVSCGAIIYFLILILLKDKMIYEGIQLIKSRFNYKLKR